MKYILQNRNIQLLIDAPLNNYNFSRFDWTGKIVQFTFRNIPFTVTEKQNVSIDNHLGKGFYNEFGMDTALGFNEVKEGEWFHKIGIGLLQKGKEPYEFLGKYRMKPAKFSINSSKERVCVSCTSENILGYAYVLTKEIILKDKGFDIEYCLENLGSKNIVTDEYNHNFLGIDNDFINQNYTLHFPFVINPENFTETINTEQKVYVKGNKVGFYKTPEEQFFFRNVTGGKFVDATWDLIHLEKGIGIRETGNFLCDKINLWGWKHVISPEMFYKMQVSPGSKEKWIRQYRVLI